MKETTSRLSRLEQAAELDAVPAWQRMDGSPKVVAIGEVLWDLFPDGPRLGGAPANFACHATALGAAVRLISRVGDDDYGRRALQQLSELGVDTTLVGTDMEHPTGTVAIATGDSGEPGYRFAPDTAWDHLHASPAAQKTIEEADAICFGTLAQRSETSRSAIISLLDAASPNSLRLCDLNLREPFVDENVVLDSLKRANALKLNEDELNRLGEWCELTGTPEDHLRQLQRMYQLDLVIWTRGPKGSVLLLGDSMDTLPGSETAVVNSVGAGDSFAAAVVTGMLHGIELPAINQQAAAIASYVCAQTGAVPELPEHLRNAFR